MIFGVAYGDAGMDWIKAEGLHGCPRQRHDHVPSPERYGSHGQLAVVMYGSLGRPSGRPTSWNWVPVTSAVPAVEPHEVVLS